MNIDKKYDIDYEKGIVNVGNLERLKNVIQKALNGERISIGFIGGSITQGSLSSSVEKCYAHRVYQWWCKTFPNAEFVYINAGIGGTTSEFGVARADKDLISQKPDFVIIEFSVNDESTEHFKETYEGLVRKVYGEEWNPALLLVYNVYYDNGANAQLIHGEIGRYYELPAVSMQSTIYSQVLSGKIKKDEITPDGLHPNDVGHKLVANVITYFLDKVLKEVDECKEYKDSNIEIDRNNDLPKPLTLNAYESSVCYQNMNISPILNGFVADTSLQHGITDCFKNGWIARNVGDSIKFEVSGTGIAVQYRKSVNTPTPIAEVIVDDDELNAIRLDGNFDENWGDKLELDTVLEHGKSGVHQVEIRLVEAHNDDVVPFYLVSIIASQEV